MSQGQLPFKYEEEKKTSGMTALAGLPVYLDLIKKMGFRQSIRKHLKVRKGCQGWTDEQIVTSLILLNLAGGDCVDDIRIMEADDGFCEVLKKTELHGLKRKDRRVLLNRWRKHRTRTVPSPSSIFRYLEAFHNPEQESMRHGGKAFIPVANEHLRALLIINKDIADFAGNQNPEVTATLDMDATVVATNKKESLYCYKGYKSYQPINTWWAEQGIILHTEFRDGNVPAGYEQLRVLKEAVGSLPDTVKNLRIRSDTAGYQHNLLRYCEMAENQRFGRIEFAIGCSVTAEFRKAVAEVEDSDWKPLYRIVDGRRQKTDIEWAEVCFVPNAIGHSKNGPEYRYLAKREKMKVQLPLPGMEQQLQLPFQTMNMGAKEYKLFGMVTNMDWEGGRLINWHHKRCGKSEEAHSVMKHDLAGAKLPSGDFGENAAWWWIMVLAHNLNMIMKTQALGRAWSKKRMKAIRFSFINLPGRVVKRSRSLIIRLAGNHPSFELLIEARKRISMMVPVESG